MALIKCIDCNKEFSDRVNECPNCGCPIEAIKAFPFNTIEEKDGYEHYLTLLQSNEEEVYTWTICKTCGETAQVDALIFVGLPWKKGNKSACLRIQLQLKRVVFLKYKLRNNQKNRPGEGLL